MGIEKKSVSNQGYLLAKWLGIAFVIPSYHRTIGGEVSHVYKPYYGLSSSQ